MRRTIMLLMLGALALAGSASARTNTYFGFQIGVGNAPPPPRVVYYSEPDVMMVPGTQVYYVDNSAGYDEFRYGPYYYICNDGYWYRGRSYRGPFRVVDVRSVPRVVFTARVASHDRGWHRGQGRMGWRGNRDWRYRDNNDWRDRNNNDWRDRNDPNGRDRNDPNWRDRDRDRR